MASPVPQPHMRGSGRSRTQTRGLCGRPNNRQRLSDVSCTQRTPAGLPPGIPGIADEMEGAMQQAPHPALQSTVVSPCGGDRSTLLAPV